MTGATTREQGDKPGFLTRITWASAWGQGLDGYDLGILSVALPVIILELNMSAAWTGLVAASSLIGIFIGGPLFGYLTDRFGRRLVFIGDLFVFLVTAVAQIFITEPWHLFVIRLLMGVAIGAEYSIGATMLSEFSPAKGRGHRLSMLEVSWFVGYVISVAVSYLLLLVPGFDWRLVLATGAVPAVVCLIIRRGLPESPRWLVGKGRTDEARAIVEKFLGRGVFEKEDFAGEQAGANLTVGASLRIMFAPGQRRNTIFACSFYAMLVAPYFAISTFEPTLLASLSIPEPELGTLAINAVAAVGALTGALLIERVGRRQLLIGPFWVCAIALAVVGLWTSAPGTVVVLCFMVFAFLNATSSDLTTVYPNELFPTAVRTTGTGLATAFSRIAAAIGTFLVPLAIDTIGTPVTMLIAAAVCVGGAVLSQFMAPETTGVSLTRTAGLGAGRVPRAAGGVA